LAEPKHLGPIRLVPYVRGKVPGDRPRVSQADIDHVLKAYSRFHRHVLKQAVLVEVGDWELGMDPEPAGKAFFDARRNLAFAALAKRRLFRHFDYTNSDTYELVVQRYVPGDPRGFAFDTRRRDTGTSHYWTADHFAFPRPQHVDAHATVNLDEALVVALSRLSASQGDINEAIEEFISANTDSMSIPMHVEMVMMKSAFERLFGIGRTAKEFEASLRSVFKDIAEVPFKKRRNATRWAARWGDVRPLFAWARDFCVVRGSSAHGKRGDPGKPVWTVRHHLAFASILFPLIIKKILAEQGLMVLDGFDLERLRRIEWYLTTDPYGEDAFDDEENRQHPWVEIDSDARIAVVSKPFYDQMTEQLSKAK
jgi:hypothetical protein